jgi:hypothetical protein
VIAALALVALTAPAQEPAPPRTFTPVRRAEVRLGEPPPPSEIRDVLAFGFDGASRLRFVRREEEGVALVRLDATGAFIAATPVPERVGDTRELDWFALPSPHWLAVVVPYADDRPGQAWCVDETTGAVADLPGFPAGGAERVVERDAAQLLVLGADGRPWWYDLAADRATLLPPPSSGSTPSWQAELDAARPTLKARMADGTLRSDYRRNVQVAPDGRLWTTDGQDLVRLGADGVVELALRAPARADVLEAPGRAAIDSAFGRVLVQDVRTRALHVFDASGARTLVCRTRPEELEELRFPLALGCTSDGGAFAASKLPTNRPVVFGPDGQSRGIVTLAVAGAGFFPGRDAYWGWRRHPVRIGPDGDHELELLRRPDGSDWRDVRHLAVTRAEHVAVLDLPRRARGWAAHVATHEPGRAVVARFDASGAPLSQHELPEGIYPTHVAHAGDWILVHSFGSDAWLLDVRDGSTWKLDVEAELDPVYEHDLGLSPGGDELWLLQAARRRLWTYSLPD